MKASFQNHLSLAYWIPKLIFSIIWLSHTSQLMSPSGKFGVHDSLYGIVSEDFESALDGGIFQEYHLLDAPSRSFPTDLTHGNAHPNAPVQVTGSLLEGHEDNADWTKCLQSPRREDLGSSREDSMVPNMPELGQSPAWLDTSPLSSQVFKGHQSKREWNDNAFEDMHGTSIIPSNYAEQFSPRIQATQSQSANFPFQETNGHSPSSILRENIYGYMNTWSSTYPLEYISHPGPSSIPLRPEVDGQSGVTFPDQYQPSRRNGNFIEQKQKSSSRMTQQEYNENDFKDLNQNDERVSHIPPLFTYNFERNEFEDLQGNSFNIQNFQDHSPDTRVSVLAESFTRHLVLDLLTKLRNPLTQSKLTQSDFYFAQKIWTVEHLVPFVYFIVSQNPTLQVWNVIKDFIVFLLLHYQRKLLSSSGELDYVHLARFLLWQTDMFFHMTNPSIRSSLTIEEEAQQEIEYKHAVCKSSISRMFMSIYRPRYFSSMKSRHRSWNSLLKQHIDLTWEHDMTQNYPSNGYDSDKRNRLWDNWTMTSHLIMSQGDLKLYKTIEEMFFNKTYVYQNIFQRWNEVQSLTRRFGRFHEGQSINVYYIEGFYKYIHSFDYLLTSYIPKGGSIWGLSQSDHYLTVLSKSLIRKNHQEDDDTFWAKFKLNRMEKSKASAASLKSQKKRKQID